MFTYTYSVSQLRRCCDNRIGYRSFACYLCTDVRRSNGGCSSRRDSGLLSDSESRCSQRLSDEAATRSTDAARWNSGQESRCRACVIPLPVRGTGALNLR